MTEARKLLLMDDDENVRILVARMARIVGVELVAAAHDEEAVASFRKARDSGRPFDAVILDLTIPGGKGAVEVLAELREIDPSIRGIVTSGYSEGGIIGSYRDHGFDAALPKPFVAKELGEVLEAVLGGQEDGAE